VYVRRAALREVEARQQLATDTHRHENQKLLAEILTVRSSPATTHHLLLITYY